MSTVVRAGGPAHFLSLVPHLLGFVPSRSLVLVPFAGRRSIGAMRFDLPADAVDEVDRFASTCIGMVCRLPEADAIAIVTYTDERLLPGALARPHRELVEAIMRRADSCGIAVRDALCVAADAWASHLDTDVAPELRDLAEISVGSEPALPRLGDGDQSSGAELPPVSGEHTASTREALEALERAVHTICGEADVSGSGDPAGSAGDPSGRPPSSPPLDPRVLAAACRLDELPALFEDALTWDAASLAPLDAATLVWCLARPSLRDIALVQWCGDEHDGEVALEAQLQWENGADYPADLGMRMWGEGPTPDRERLARALELARNAAASAPESLRPGPLAMCAWLSWALGRSTHAESFARRACELEPEHGLGEIVRSFVAVGHLPDWAFRPETPGAEPRSRRR